MNNRLMTVVATVMLLGSVSGCGTVRNFLFGRGARCGQPVQPMLGQTIVPSSVANSSCNTCNGNAYAGSADCGCYGAAYGGVEGVVGGGYIGSQMIDGSYIDGGYGNGYGRWDNFDQRHGARKYDSQGDLIIHEDPVPPNAIVAP